MHMSNVEERLKSLGIKLPEPPKPQGNYEELTVNNNNKCLHLTKVALKLTVPALQANEVHIYLHPHNREFPWTVETSPPSLMQGILNLQKRKP